MICENMGCRRPVDPPQKKFCGRKCNHAAACRASRARLAKIRDLAREAAAEIDALPEPTYEEVAPELVRQWRDVVAEVVVERGQSGAEAFLTAFLRDGAKPASVVQEAADECGIASRTLKRARAALGVVATRESLPGAEKGKGRWVLSLPKARA